MDEGDPTTPNTRHTPCSLLRTTSDAKQRASIKKTLVASRSLHTSSKFLQEISHWSAVLPVLSTSGTIADSDVFTYDKASRKSTEGLTISGQTYTTTTGYNTRGQLTGYTYPDGTAVGRTYTDRGELYQLSHASTTIDTRSYDDGGRMTGSTYNNGVSETRGYNADNSMPTAPATNNSQRNTMYQCSSLQPTASGLS